MGKTYLLKKQAARGTKHKSAANKPASKRKVILWINRYGTMYDNHLDRYKAYISRVKPKDPENWFEVIKK